MTMEQILEELYGSHWTIDELKALEIATQNLIEEDRKRRYQQRVGD